MYTFDTTVKYSDVNRHKKMDVFRMIEYFQDICITESESLGMGVGYLKEHNRLWVIAGWKLDIIEFPDIYQKIRISTWPYEFTKFWGYRNCQICDEYGKAMVNAYAIWVYMDTKKMRPVNIDDEVLNTYTFSPKINMEYEPRKIILPANMEEHMPVTVGKTYIDTNNHMNNVRYIELATDYMDRDKRITCLKAEYIKPFSLGDVITPKSFHDDKESTVALYGEDKKPHTIVSFIYAGGSDNIGE